MQSYKKFLLIYFVSWFAWSFIHIAVIFYAGYTLSVAIADSIVNNALLSLISLAFVNVLRFYRPGVSTSFNLVLWCILGSAACVFLSKGILIKIFSENVRYQSMLTDTLLLRYFTAFLIIGCVILISWIRNTLVSQKEEIMRNAAIEKMSKEAELNRLHQQMQPHFLFNSLNSISALIVVRPDDAQKMVQNLSMFMRNTLKKESNHMTTLRDELQHLQLYLEIEKQRFGHRLITHIKTEEEHLTKKIPGLLLQPVVENAIKFGLYGTTGECEITINTKAENNNLIITVSNPFDSDSAESNRGTGFGISSTQRRLYLLFGRNDLVKTETNKNIYIITLIIPQHDNESNNY